MLTEEQQEEQQRRPWQMQQKMSTSSGKQIFSQNKKVKLEFVSVFVLLKSRRRGLFKIHLILSCPKHPEPFDTAPDTKKKNDDIQRTCPSLEVP